ncbi:galactose-binding domain-like protein [Mycena belliarum]|uniref:Galactose-binding domain-like protein n=1 Tax=Mycena belliarum TaxID=1033014 RepID=A0AAD6U6J6_9AGAR|nr:galactose-binding domain-like protein [Mycena belliae]
MASGGSAGSRRIVLVGGPYLVRSASISGPTLALTGDLNTTVSLTVIAPPNFKRVTWNGASVRVAAGVSCRGGLVGSLDLVTLPKLTGWIFKDSLPEIDPNFDDSTWTVANRTTTNSPLKPLYGDGRALYGCDYGFSTNHRNLVEEVDAKFMFPAGAVRAGDNVITIVQDNMGLNETRGTPDTNKSPRGVRGFALDSGSFGTWKVQGKVGGYTGCVERSSSDKTRGVLNEGGLFGERQGWHLPGFDTSSWMSRDLAAGLPGPSAGVGFFVTTFNLNIPTGIEAFMSFTFEDPLGQDYRLLLWVNGWMMGKRVANLGQVPQAKFPVHQGILNFRGVNTVAVALWSLTPTAVSPNLQLVLDGTLDGGVPGVATNNPSWSAVGRV